MVDSSKRSANPIAEDSDSARKVARKNEAAQASPAACSNEQQQQPPASTDKAANSSSKQEGSQLGNNSTSSSRGDSFQLCYAVSCDRGSRTTMEDVHVCLIDQKVTDTDSTITTSCIPSVSHFAVYDGHGGSDCAHFVSTRLHDLVVQAGLLTRKAAAVQAGSCSSSSSSWQWDIKAAKQAVIKGFTAADDLLLKECEQRNWQDGATAVAVWVLGDTALVANVGDAKCVLARVSDKAGNHPGHLKALVLTKDHLAIYPSERSRIEKAGGHVTADGRLNGRIQVSRAFGDAQFKKSGSSALPDVTAFSISTRDCFMLCACDGFWGVMDPQGAVNLVQQQLAQGKDDKAITNRLLNEAVIERRCKDNCTVMLIRFDRSGRGSRAADAAGAGITP